MDIYFNTKERIDTYDKAEPTNVRYNLDLLSCCGLAPELYRDKKVLDAGCGFGMLINEFKKCGAKCYATDASSYAIKMCNQRYAGINLYEASAEIFPDTKFDLITCFGVLGILNHEKQAKFIGNAYKALNENGVLFATAPNLNRPFYLGKKKNDYSNARTEEQWKLLTKQNWFDNDVFSVLRIPKSEVLFGEKVFVRFWGDPIVIKVRKVPKDL